MKVRRDYAWILFDVFVVVSVLIVIFSLGFMIVNSTNNHYKEVERCEQKKCQSANLTPKMLYRDGCLCVEIPK